MPVPLAALIGRGVMAAGGGGGASGMALDAAMSGRIPNVGKQLEQWAKPLGALDKILTGMVSKTQEAVGVLSSLTDAIGSMGNSLAKFVGKANPAVVEQFTLALNDSEAVLGKILTPALQSLTKAAGVVGDAFAYLEPIFRKFAASMGGVLEGVFQTITETLKENAPLIDALLTLVGNAIKGIAKVFDWAMKELSGALRFVNSIMKALGFGQDVKEGASSKGSAVRSVSIGGTGTALYNAAAEKAFMQGTPEEKSPVEKTNTKLDAILTFMSGNLTAATIGSLLGTAFSSALAAAAPQLAKDAEAVETIAADPLEFLRVMRDMIYGQ